MPYQTIPLRVVFSLLAYRLGVLVALVTQPI